MIHESSSLIERTCLNVTWFYENFQQFVNYGVFPVFIVTSPFLLIFSCVIVDNVHRNFKTLRSCWSKKKIRMKDRARPRLTGFSTLSQLWLKLKLYALSTFVSFACNHRHVSGSEVLVERSLCAMINFSRETRLVIRPWQKY